jgi:hypothetical protein
LFKGPFFSFIVQFPCFFFLGKAAHTMGSFNSSREEELLKVIGGEGAQECNALGAQLVGLLAKAS